MVVDATGRLLLAPHAHICACSFDALAGGHHRRDLRERAVQKLAVARPPEAPEVAHLVAKGAIGARIIDNEKLAPTDC